MSNFSLSKKLQPAKKAWKSITTTIQTKLHKSIKNVKHTLTTLPPFRPLIRRKPPRSSTHHHLRRHHLPKPIFVDELHIIGYDRPKVKNPKMNLKTEQKQSLAPKTYIKASESSSRATNLELLPKVRGIDERAEEFISKFKEDMKIEREQSILDFQEMLARSV